MQNTKRLNSFNRHFVITLAVIVVFGIALYIYVRAENQIDFANELRIKSLLVADELRQSSNDLTYMVRSYVATSDPIYKQYYQDILAIRDGKKVRPAQYHNVNWNLEQGGFPLPSSDSGQAISLLQLMQQASLTQTELAKLTEAKTNSDALTHVELAAMQLIDSTSPLTETTRAKANFMLQDQAYHQAKVNIMRPIREFNLMVDQRTLDAIKFARETVSLLSILLTLLGLMVIWLLWRTYLAMGLALGTSMQGLHAHIRRLGNSDFQSIIPVNKGMEGSVIGWLSDTQLRLAKQERDRKEAELRDNCRSHVLELIASGKPLPMTLEAIVHCVELENPAMLCSILLLDDAGKHLLIGAGPSLPDFYNEAIHGLEVGMGVGSCGSAILTNERIIVDDIQNSPYWLPFKELAASAGLVACWSQPIRSTQGIVLGTFATYHPDVHLPTEEEIALIERAAYLASIAIEQVQNHILLRNNELRFHKLFQSIPSVAVQGYDREGKTCYWNEASENLYGYSADEALGQSLFDLIVPPAMHDVVRNAMQQMYESKQPIPPSELTLITKDKSEVNVFSSHAFIHVPGQPPEMFCIDVDLTQRKQDEEKLRLAAIVFSHAREGIMITNGSGTIIEVNGTFSLITGYTREEAIGQNPRILKSGRHLPEFFVEIWKCLLEKDHWDGEIWNRRKCGEVYPENLNISSVRNASGQVQNYVALFSDITQMKEHQRQLEHIAHYDPLTHLPNRVLLADRLNQAMVHSQRHQRSIAVAFLDLDGFKEVNDAYGHDLGDELLITLSQRIKGALREGDTLARIGGDEFVAVLADLAKVEDCHPVLERMLQAVADPVILGEIVTNVTASIGVAIYPQDNADADQLMRHADQAMYVAKQAGKDRYHLFDTAQDDAINIQRENIGNIRSALKRCEFVLHYQPKVNMHTGKVIGVEALIRWQHPSLGLLFPASFLPVIENHTMSLDLGEWVINSALIQISQWQNVELNLPISINIAAYQLQHASFTSRLAALLAAHPEVKPHCLELEVLETSALSDTSQVSATMQACIALGVRFALDDFGTGYSSLTYFRRLPAYMIKIDQSFVRDMLTDADDLAIIQGVVGLAKAFKREVIAEGVESIEHGVALLQLGCHLAQGYGIARPMPADEIPAWIKSWKPDNSWRI